MYKESFINKYYVNYLIFYVERKTLRFTKLKSYN